MQRATGVCESLPGSRGSQKAGEMNEVTFDWFPKALNPNWRGHWSKKAKAAKAYRYDCFILALKGNLDVDWEGPVNVSLTFHPPDKRRRDLDNCIASVKNLLDGVADALAVNDSRFRLSCWIGEPVNNGSVHVAVARLGIENEKSHSRFSS